MKTMMLKLLFFSLIFFLSYSIVVYQPDTLYPPQECNANCTSLPNCCDCTDDLSMCTSCYYGYSKFLGVLCQRCSDIDYYHCSECEGAESPTNASSCISCLDGWFYKKNFIYFNRYPMQISQNDVRCIRPECHPECPEDCNLNPNNWTWAEMTEYADMWLNIDDPSNEILDLQCDDCFKTISLSYSTNYYNNIYTNITITSNGLISFIDNDPLLTSFSPIMLPNATAPIGIIAVFWSDLNPTKGGNIYFKEFEPDEISGMPINFIAIEYKDVAPNLGTGTLNAQVYIYPNGVVAISYKSVPISNNLWTLGGQDDIGYYGYTFCIATSTANPECILSTPSLYFHGPGCGSCLEGTPNATDGMCALCPTYCSSCDKDTLGCTSCFSGYSLTGVLGAINTTCAECHSSCLGCDPITLGCTLCEVGEYLSGLSGGSNTVCLPCSTNCDYCTNSSSCIICEDGWTLFDERCVNYCGFDPNQVFYADADTISTWSRSNLYASYYPSYNSSEHCEFVISPSHPDTFIVLQMKMLDTRFGLDTIEIINHITDATLRTYTGTLSNVAEQKGNGILDPYYTPEYAIVLFTLPSLRIEFQSAIDLLTESRLGFSFNYYVSGIPPDSIQDLKMNPITFVNNDAVFEVSWEAGTQFDCIFEKWLVVIQRKKCGTTEQNYRYIPDDCSNLNDFDTQFCNITEFTAGCEITIKVSQRCSNIPSALIDIYASSVTAYASPFIADTPYDINVVYVFPGDQFTYVRVTWSLGEMRSCEYKNVFVNVTARNITGPTDYYEVNDYSTNSSINMVWFYNGVMPNSVVNVYVSLNCDDDIGNPPIGHYQFTTAKRALSPSFFDADSYSLPYDQDEVELEWDNNTAIMNDCIFKEWQIRCFKENTIGDFWQVDFCNNTAELEGCEGEYLNSNDTNKCTVNDLTQGHLYLYRMRVVCDNPSANSDWVALYGGAISTDINGTISSEPSINVELNPIAPNHYFDLTVIPPSSPGTACEFFAWDVRVTRYLDMSVSPIAGDCRQYLRGSNTTCTAENAIYFSSFAHGATYGFEVRELCYNSLASSNWSDITWATTLRGAQRPPQITIDFIDRDYCNISWSSYDFALMGYDCVFESYSVDYIVQSEQGHIDDCDTIDPNITECSITGLIPGRVYYFTLQVICENDWATPPKSWPSSPAYVPSASKPLSLTWTPGGSPGGKFIEDQILLEWTPGYSDCPSGFKGWNITMIQGAYYLAPYDVIWSDWGTGDMSDCEHPKGYSDCCSYHYSNGCDLPSCESSVCAVLPECCDSDPPLWGNNCIDSAKYVCGDSYKNPWEESSLLEWDCKAEVRSASSCIVKDIKPAEVYAFAIQELCQDSSEDSAYEYATPNFMYSSALINTELIRDVNDHTRSYIRWTNPTSGRCQNFSHFEFHRFSQVDGHMVDTATYFCDNAVTQNSTYCVISNATLVTPNIPDIAFLTGYEICGAVLIGNTYEIQRPSLPGYANYYTKMENNATWQWWAGTNDKPSWFGMYGSAALYPSSSFGVFRSISSEQVIIPWRECGMNVYYKDMFYIFGGYLKDGSVEVVMNDLWAFDTANSSFAWIGGSNIGNQEASDVDITAWNGGPGGRVGGGFWVSDDGNTLFVGFGYNQSTDFVNETMFADMWAYDVSTYRWSLVWGDYKVRDSYANSSGVPFEYSIYNAPGARAFPVVWSKTGNKKLYLFGGLGFSLEELFVGSVPLGDLWAFDYETQLWASLLSTEPATECVQSFGTKGEPSINNIPTPRTLSMGFNDFGDNHLYLFGGIACSTTHFSGYGVMDDIWDYNIDTKEWTWLSGSDEVDVVAVWPDAENVGTFSSEYGPGSRTRFHGWKDGDSIVIHAGFNFSDERDTRYLYGDLWKYSFEAKAWAFLSGATYAIESDTYVFGSWIWQLYAMTNIAPYHRAAGNSFDIDLWRGLKVLHGGRMLLYDSGGDTIYNDWWSIVLPLEKRSFCGPLNPAWPIEDPFCSSYPFRDSVCKPNCSAGYYGEPTLVCQSNGNWLYEQPCVACNSRCLTCDHITGHCTSCESPLELVTVEPDVICSVDCGTPNIPFASYAECLDHTWAHEYVDGNACGGSQGWSVECLPGCNENGNPIRKCSYDGVWVNGLLNVECEDITEPQITSCPSEKIFSTEVGVNYVSSFNWMDGVAATDNAETNLTYSPIFEMGGAPTTPTDGKYEYGVWTIKINVCDSSNNCNNSCVYTLNVIDSEPPSYDFCPPDHSLDSPTDPFQPTKFIYWPSLNIHDNVDSLVDIDVQVVSSPGGYDNESYFYVGITTIQYSLTDLSLNVNDTCTFTITVSDTEPPSYDLCPDDIVTSNTYLHTPYSTVTWTEPIYTDNYDPVIFPTVVSDPIGYVNGFNFSIGITTIHYMSIDSAGNENNTCIFNVTVIDLEPPWYENCPSNILNNTELHADYNYVDWIAPTVHDNSGAAPTVEVITSPTSSLDEGSDFPFGVTTVTYKLTDGAGNVEESCSFEVNIVDLEPPQIFNCPSNLRTPTDPGLSYVVYYWPALEYSDNVDAISLLDVDLVSSPTAGLSNGSNFELGVTTLTYTITDTNGNVNNECVWTVEVYDNEDPTVTNCPSNVYKNTLSGLPYGNATWTNPDINDNLDLHLDVTIQSDGVEVIVGGTISYGLFPIGTTRVVYNVSDDYGNIHDACRFDVVITDVESPVVTSCPSNIQQNTDYRKSFATVNWIEPVATDNSGVDPVDIGNGSSLVGTSFGCCDSYFVSYLFEDPSSNVNSDCSFLITIYDEEAPFYDVCPGDSSYNTDPGKPYRFLSFYYPNATDNVSPVRMIVSSQPEGRNSSNINFPIGFTMISFDFVDIYENHNATCSFLIDIHDDEPPSYDWCPPNQSPPTALHSDRAIVYWPPLVNVKDNDGKSVSISYTSTPSGYSNGSQFLFGETTITYTLTDTAGNQNSSCSFIIDVIDVEPPQITCPSDFHIPIPGGETQTPYNMHLFGLSYYFASDNIDGDEVPVSIFSTPIANLTADSSFPLGYNHITHTACDHLGNCASCSFFVNVSCDYGSEVVGGVCTLCSENWYNDQYAFEENVFGQVCRVCDDGQVSLIGASHCVYPPSFSNYSSTLPEDCTAAKLAFHIEFGGITVYAPNITIHLVNVPGNMTFWHGSSIDEEFDEDNQVISGDTMFINETSLIFNCKKNYFGNQSMVFSISDGVFSGPTNYEITFVIIPLNDEPTWTAGEPFMLTNCKDVTTDDGGNIIRTDQPCQFPSMFSGAKDIDSSRIQYIIDTAPTRGQLIAYDEVGGTSIITSFPHNVSDDWIYAINPNINNAKGIDKGTEIYTWFEAYVTDEVASSPNVNISFEITCPSSLYLNIWTKGVNKMDACTTCIEGADCSNDGSFEPAAAAGYWQVKPDYIFLKCEPPDACLGGDLGCNTWYEGRRCGICQPGSYRLSGSCVQCPETKAWWIFLIAALVVILLLTLLVWLALKGPNLGFISILFTYAQSLAIVSKIRLRWPNDIDNVFTAISITNLNIELAAVECDIPRFSWSLKYLLTFFFPIFIALLIFCGWCIYAFSIHFIALYFPKYAHDLIRGSPFGRAVAIGFLSIRTFVLFATFLYIAIASTAVELFDCTQLIDGSYLDSDPSMKCYSDDWYFLLPFGIFGTIVYGIGIPVIFIYLLMNRPVGKHSRQFLGGLTCPTFATAINDADLSKTETSKYQNTDDDAFADADPEEQKVLDKDKSPVAEVAEHLADSKWMLPFGSLVINYTPRCYYWEILIMSRKLLISLAKIFASNYPMLQATSVTLFLFIAVLLQSHYHAYESVAMNRLEFFAITSSLLILLGGLLCYGEPIIQQRPELRDTLGKVMVFFFCTTFIIVLWQAYKGMKHQFHKWKNPKRAPRKTIYEAPLGQYDAGSALPMGASQQGNILVTHKSNKSASNLPIPAQNVATPPNNLQSPSLMIPPVQQPPSPQIEMVNRAVNHPNRISQFGSFDEKSIDLPMLPNEQNQNAAAWQSLPPEMLEQLDAPHRFSSISPNL